MAKPKVDLGDPGVELIPDPTKPGTFTMAKNGVVCTCSFKPPVFYNSDLDPNQSATPKMMNFPCQTDCANFRTINKKVKLEGHQGDGQNVLQAHLGCGAGTVYRIKKVWDEEEYAKQKDQIQKKSKIHTV